MPTAAEYLADHNNDAQRALEAAAADVAQRERENGTARSFRRTFEPILRELDIPSTQDGVDTLRERLTAQGDSADTEALRELLADLTDVLERLGIDFDAPDDEVNAALESLPERWQAGQTAITERDTMRQDAELDTLAGKAKADSTVFKDLVRRDGLTPKLTGEGDAQAVHLFDKDGKDLGTVKDYAGKTPTWAAYQSSLFPTQTTPQGGTVIHGQAGAGSGNSGVSGVRDFLQRQEQASAYVDPLQSRPAAPQQ